MTPRAKPSKKYALRLPSSQSYRVSAEAPNFGLQALKLRLDSGEPDLSNWKFDWPVVMALAEIAALIDRPCPQSRFRSTFLTLLIRSTEIRTHGEIAIES